ncbi:MAG: protein adenylyltransferase SelO [Flavobacterium sp.]
MKLKINWNLKNTYASLPESLFQRQEPTLVTNPKGLLWNFELANTLGIFENDQEPEDWELYFSGNKIAEASIPLAQAYAGHQFGHFNRLGDGRAILLGEQISASGDLFDLQLKGSGPTPYSRRGDGRATLKSMLREYIMSEAMFGLGIPTTRSLAVVASGESVIREQVQPGAVLTRVAKSHIRVGTFEYIHQFEDKEVLRTFFDYTVKRHFPECLAAEQPVLCFFEKVMEQQIDLVVHWMRVGFIHGVMNTDNVSISGETIDYGPCAFMNRYDPNTVYSSIDRNGRYAFGQQAPITQWNLMCLAETLLPLIHENIDIAVEMITPLLQAFPIRYEQAWKTMMAHKIGLQQNEASHELILELLKWMNAHKADYTNTFIKLMHSKEINEMIYEEKAFLSWRKKWETAVAQQEGGFERAYTLMQRSNPCYIPRNSLVEKALDNFQNLNDRTQFDVLLDVLKHPYQLQEGATFLMQATEDESTYQTFCGT